MVGGVGYGGGFGYNNDGTQALADIGEFFASLGEWIAEAANWFWELVVGKLPEDNYEDVYRFAEEWGNFAELFSDYLEVAGPHGQNISGRWSRAGTATAFAKYWYDVSQAVAEIAQAGVFMQIDVASYGLQLEIGTYMYVINLVLLAIMLVIDIIAMIFFGAGLAKAFADFAFTRGAQEATKRGIIAAIKTILPKALGRKATQLGARGAAALPRITAMTLRRPVAGTVGRRIGGTGMVRALGG